MKVAVHNIINNIEQDELDAGRLQEVYDIDVELGKKVSLPESFNSEIRSDLVKLAVASARANRRQAYGSNPHVGKRKPMSGMKHSVEWWGKGRGVSRIMRRTGQRRGAQSPHTLGGRRAHGPKVEKDWSRKLNRNERRLARNSALAATANVDMVSNRGHRFAEEISSLPIVLGDYSENGEKIDIEAFNLNGGTRKVNAIFEALGLGDDLRRAREGRKIRAGKATMRGRVHKTPKSVLLVVASKDGLAKAARNLPGVDVVAAKDLSAEHLAPGGDLGRLTVFTKAAVEALN
ncbi:MAG TPA: 50S ribosomal protein L4 [Candidatus Poseidoniales archaeon]|jgi:large subunit ribosomal protein L4e|nr:MAG: 50S ribosomal protein L4 [Euryarchaeota archaeon]DAC40925.1 MAG TPA: 50S ribosomal protein L4 [Candidatus Poseidoniales archaeon]HIH57147.1 50S ribosomal protein L4 [Candidatus Poseidoniaceae archaeon]|tara:strand:- start:687 stop:1556 length:870 start_codon:yes stop_codon:yes gene_type:complete